MSDKDAKSKWALGFLTVVEHPQYGLFGGYLLLNAMGRPLEFHCTAPIKPNRAQEILYGPTLQPFLYGEQIGKTLIGHSEIPPQVLCVDLEPALSVREHIAMPVVMVFPPDGEQTASAETGPQGTTFRLDAPHRGPRLATFELGRNRLAVPERDQDDQCRVRDLLADIAESFDLAEPFERIREAIAEAQQAVR